MPPGSAKSTYASVEFPAWYLGRRPQENIIAASHTQELAEHFGRQVRNIIAGPDYKILWGSTLSDDSRSVGRWATSEGGMYFGVGVGSSVTGRRGNLGLIDDPVKGKEAADSKAEKEKTWNWYITDFLTRLKPDAVQVIIQTRWSEDDLAGRILDREYSQWEVLSLPMEAQDNDPLGRKVGERLWSDYFTDEMVQQAKRDPRSWSALYQQNPTPDEGTYFKREWFKWYTKPPANAHKYLSSDFAVNEDEDADSTEIGIHSVIPDGDLYACVDGWGGKKAADIWIEEYLTLVERHKTLCEFNEAGVIRRSIEPFLKKRRQERKVFGRCEWITSIADKAARARSLQSMAACGRVWLPDNEYGNRVLADLLKFPAGADDDTVDMLGLMARAIDQAHPGIAPPAKLGPKPRDRYGFDDEPLPNWKTA